MGRALRNVFLESAIHIMPLPDMPNLDLFDEADLKEEADRRKPKVPRRLKDLRTIEGLTNRTIAIILLRWLKAWLDEDATLHPDGPLSWEIDATRYALRLLPLPPGDTSLLEYPRESLILEARERYTRRLRYEDNRRFRAERKVGDAEFR